MGGWVNLTVDRYGTAYLGLNGGTGFLGKSLSATGVWLTQSNTPTPQQLDSHFSGWSGNVAAGYGLGG